MSIDSNSDRCLQLLLNIAPTYTNQEKIELLIRAIVDDSEKTLLLLIHKYKDLNLNENKEEAYNLFCIGAKNGSFKCIEALLKLKIDYKIPNQSDITPLFIAKHWYDTFNINEPYPKKDKILKKLEKTIKLLEKY